MINQQSKIRSCKTATEKLHRINSQIDASEVRLISEDGNQIGIMPVEDALAQAESADLDLVEISPKAEPPVCRLMDYGKFRYSASKKRHDQKRKQKQFVIKEIKFRPGTDVGDYDVKVRKLREFLESGNKVKVTMRFRGREMMRQELGLEMLNRVEQDLAEISSVEHDPILEGRQLVMVLAPAK